MADLQSDKLLTQQTQSDLNLRALENQGPGESSRGGKRIICLVQKSLGMNDL
jgi:hypothetical protein